MASALKESSQSCFLRRSHSGLLVGRIQSYKLSGERAKDKESVSISNSSNVFTFENSVKKVVVTLQHMYFCVLRYKTADYYGFAVLNI